MEWCGVVWVEVVEGVVGSGGVRGIICGLGV